MMMNDPTKAKATVIEPCDKLEVRHVDVPEVVSNVEAVKAWVDDSQVTHIVAVKNSRKRNQDERTVINVSWEE